MTIYAHVTHRRVLMTKPTREHQLFMTSCIVFVKEQAVHYDLPLGTPVVRFNQTMKLLEMHLKVVIYWIYWSDKIFNN